MHNIKSVIAIVELVYILIENDDRLRDKYVNDASSNLFSFYESLNYENLEDWPVASMIISLLETAVV